MRSSLGFGTGLGGSISFNEHCLRLPIGLILFLLLLALGFPDLVDRTITQALPFFTKR